MYLDYKIDTMRNIFDIIDPLPEFSAPRYDIGRDATVVYLDKNKVFSEFEHIGNTSYQFTCPLMANLNQTDISNFKTTVHTNKHLETIVLIDGGAERGKGIFALFNRILK